MSACFAVVVDGNTEIKYFPFYDMRSADDAESEANLFLSKAQCHIGENFPNNFHIRVVRPKVVFRLLSGVIVECDLDDVDILESRCADLSDGLSGFGFNRTVGYCGNWDLDGAEVIEYVA